MTLHKLLMIVTEYHSAKEDKRLCKAMSDAYDDDINRANRDRSAKRFAKAEQRVIKLVRRINYGPKRTRSPDATRPS